MPHHCGQNRDKNPKQETPRTQETGRRFCNAAFVKCLLLVKRGLDEKFETCGPHRSQAIGETMRPFCQPRGGVSFV